MDPKPAYHTVWLSGHGLILVGILMMSAGGLFVAFLGGWMEVRLPLTWFPMFFGTGAFLEGFVSRGLASVAACLIDHRLSTRSQFVSRLTRSLISGRHTECIGSESMIVEEASGTTVHRP